MAERIETQDRLVPSRMPMGIVGDKIQCAVWRLATPERHDTLSIVGLMKGRTPFEAELGRPLLFRRLLPPGPERFVLPLFVCSASESLAGLRMKLKVPTGPVRLVATVG